MLTQQTFLGASISNYTLSLGLGSQPTSMTVFLVEDRLNGDSFRAPRAGQPVTFTYGDFIFNGLIQKKEKTANEGANPTYRVELIDPRELLDGTPLILNNYSGPSQVQNLLNVYGYLQENRFGQYNRNDAGIPWTEIRNTVNFLVNNPNTFGGPINYQGNQYLTDLSALPVIPPAYRINGEGYTLMSFIDEICNAGGCDYFFTLDGQIIRLNTIYRNLVPQVGVIEDFIATTPGARAKSIGEEMRIGVTSKFVTGANVHDMYVQNIGSANTDNFSDDFIWPYWGTYENGNPIIGFLRNFDSSLLSNNEYYYQNMFNNSHTFTIDSRQIDVPGVGDTYTTDLAEIRAVESDVDTWRSFLDFNNGNRYVEDKNGNREAPYLSYYQLPNGFSTTEVIKRDVVDPEYTAMKTRLKELGADKLFAQGLLPEVTNGNTTTIIVRKPTYTNVGWYPVIVSDLNADKLFTEERCMNKNTHDSYVAAVDELKSRLSSVENYISLSGNKEGDKIFAVYKHNGIGNIHFGKAQLLGIATNFNSFLKTLLMQDITNEGQPKASILSSSPFNKTIAEQTGGNYDIFEKIHDLYQALLVYANDFYGRKFMVRIPDISSVKNADTGEIESNYSVAEAGYIPQSEFQSAINNKLVPENTFNFTIEDGRLLAYVRFDITPTEAKDEKNVLQLLNISELGPEDFFVSSDLSSLFVRCDVEQDFVYINEITSPRAIVTLPAKIRTAQVVDNESIFEQFFLQLNAAWNSENAKEAANSYLQKVGNDIMSASYEPVCKPPVSAMIPLKSNVDSYGPFVSSLAQGKVEFEKDETLAPWVYGSYELMNQAGNAKALSNTTNQTWDESGTIEFPGLPNVTPGAQLNGIGPYITNISVNISESGVTTTYSMQSWITNFGRNFDRINEKLKENVRRMQKERRDTLSRNQTPPFGSSYYNFRKFGVPVKSKTVQSASSHHLISADGTDVVMQPIYNASTQFSKDYDKKAMMSLNHLFAPMSLGESNVNMPTVPYADSNGINANSLSPFQPGDNIQGVVTQGLTPPETGSSGLTNAGNQRIVGLKAPVMIAGPAFNHLAEPVSHTVVNGGLVYVESTSTSEFTDGVYLNLPFINGSSSGEGGTVNVKVVNQEASIITVASKGSGYASNDTGTVTIDGLDMELKVARVGDYKVQSDEFNTKVSDYKAGPLNMIFDEHTGTWQTTPILLVEINGEHKLYESKPCYVLRGGLGMESRNNPEGGIDTVVCFNRFSTLQDGAHAFALYRDGNWELFAAGCGA